MNDSDISKLLPDWTLTYVLSESDSEKMYQAEKETVSQTKYSLVRAVFLPYTDENAETLGEETRSEDEIRAYTAEKLAETKKELAFLRSMSGKGGWLSLRESYDISDTSLTRALAAARFDYAMPLSDFIDENGLTQGGVLKLGIDLCRGLEHLKKADMIHGTLTPDIIFVDDNCKFRIGKIDLSVASVRKLEATETEKLAFSAPYALTDYLNNACDTYSVGLMMYYFLNGRKLPFEGEMTREEAIKERLSGRKLPEPSYNAERITKIVMKACSPEKADGYQTPYSMRKELEEAYVRLAKEIEEARIKERAKQKKLEKAEEKPESEKDISAVRIHQKDSSEIKTEREHKTKKKIIAGFIAFAAVLAALYIGVPELINKIDYRNLSRHKILLASNFYKDTDRAGEFSFNYEYDGTAKEPDIVIEGLESLVRDRDYTVKYENNIEVGQATITVEGIGDYNGKGKRTFNVKPKKPGTVEELKATEITENSVVLTWKSVENANRYVIYRFRESVNDWGDREYEVDASQTSLPITSLKPDTAYSFKVRAAFISENGNETKGDGAVTEFKTKSDNAG